MPPLLLVLLIVPVPSLSPKPTFFFFPTSLLPFLPSSLPPLPSSLASTRRRSLLTRTPQRGFRARGRGGVAEEVCRDGGSVGFELRDLGGVVGRLQGESEAGGILGGEGGGSGCGGWVWGFFC